MLLLMHFFDLQTRLPNVIPGMVLNNDEGAAKIESGTKLYISNLDHGVTNDDIKVI